MQTQVRENFMTTLGLAAIIHGTDQAVRDTAKILAKRAPGAFRKSTLLPLAASPDALEIITEEVVYAKVEVSVGKVWFNGYEYEVLVKYEPHEDYTVEEVFDLVLETFIKRGVHNGTMLVAVRNPLTGMNVTRDINMASVVKRMDLN